MLTLDAFETFIPQSRVPIIELGEQTGLSKEMLSIFRAIYGLKMISIYDQGNLESLIAVPLEKLLFFCNDISRIKYIIYVHTTGIVLPFGDAMIHRLKEKYNLESVMSFGMTMQKCVSYFKALEILTVLLAEYPGYSAIVLTGEVAFSPQLRVVPRSSIVGDAATASLFSYVGENHTLLSVVNCLISGYSKGIYLSDRDMQQFDSQFIQSTVNIIMEALQKASISIEQLACILPHNVNIPTWKKIAAALHFPIEKIYLACIARIGHAFCSDHVINLQSALSNSYLNKGDYYLMAGCGMGFYLSAAVFKY